MKIRLGYVSNSSSSSFFISFKTGSTISISIGEHSVSFDLVSFLKEHFKGGMCDDTYINIISKEKLKEECYLENKDLPNDDSTFCKLEIGEDDHFSLEMLQFMVNNKLVNLISGGI